LDPIRGVVKKTLPFEVYEKLVQIHNHIERHNKHKTPWSGLGENDTKLRAFGFMGQASLDRLDRTSPVRLHAPEKVGQDALDDEAANRKAICVLNLDSKDEDVDGDSGLNVRSTTRDFIEALNPKAAGLDPNVVCLDELIAYQINLHNGVRYLPAHLDWPLHEGFGKAIATVAIRGNATILLISGDTVMVGSEEVQPAWRFHLAQGEVYVLSQRARNRCLHAVVCDDGNRMRESLNLRFGLHTKNEAEELITKFWPDEL
jgi:hypothetical protein